MRGTGKLGRDGDSGGGVRTSCNEMLEVQGAMFLRCRICRVISDLDLVFLGGAHAFRILVAQHSGCSKFERGCAQCGFTSASRGEGWFK